MQFQHKSKKESYQRWWSKEKESRKRRHRINAERILERKNRNKNGLFCPSAASTETKYPSIATPQEYSNICWQYRTFLLPIKTLQKEWEQLSHLKTLKNSEGSRDSEILNIRAISCLNFSK